MGDHRCGGERAFGARADMDDGTIEPRRVDVTNTVVVPTRPGPVVALTELGGSPHDVDELLDHVFGAPDDGGAGPVDAVLLIAGAAVIVSALTSLLPPWALVVGIAAFALGSVLALGSIWRRAAAAQGAARLRARIGDGVLLRTDHPGVANVLAANDRCRSEGEDLAAWRRVQVDGVAHAAVLEVATLLHGRTPVLASEEQYVAARAAALEAVAEALEDLWTDAEDGDDRRAHVEARAEVERVTGSSSVFDAESLARALRGPP